MGAASRNATTNQPKGNTMTNLNHNPLIAVQIQTAPSILWEILQAPTKATATQLYQGHGTSGGIQLHSMDLGFSRYGLVLRCIEGATGRKLWQALRADKLIFSHPKHDAALAGAVMILTGA